MKKRKLCMIFLLCLALMTLVAGCRSKKETNDQGNQKGTAIYYTNTVSYTHLTLPTILRV